MDTGNDRITSWRVCNSNARGLVLGAGRRVVNGFSMVFLMYAAITSHLRALGRPLFAVLALLTLSVAVLGGDKSTAQVIDPRTIPQGSPTNQNGSNANQAGGQVQRIPTAPAIEPIQIEDRQRNMDLSDETRRLLERERDGSEEQPRLQVKPPAEPSEFEKYVESAVGREVKRFGIDLLLPENRDFAVPATSTIPPDYALNIGDTVSINLTGSVEGSADFEIDRNGRIFLPKVGEVTLVGVRYRDLQDRISRSLAKQYRGYEVTASIKQLRGIRVYVTGFANNPGAFSINSLSTMVNAVLAAGGPNAGGSLRAIKLYRNGAEVADFDLYDLIRNGDRSRDAVLQNEDVLFIPPVGQQVAVVGSVNEEAIYEARPGESLEAVLRLAGGPNGLADDSRLILYRLGDRDTVGSREIARIDAGSLAAEGGDIIQMLSKGTLARPLERQSILVRIEGEVAAPGNYFVAPNTPLADVLAKAGGLTSRAFVYGTRFTRQSVRAQQRESYLEAIDQFETTLLSAPLSTSSIESNPVRTEQLAAAKALLEKMRLAEPDGRLVLELPVTSSTLPGNLILENNDRIVIPPRVDTVGVFGAVYRPASFLMPQGPRPRIKDYVERAGGTIRTADRGNIFVVRANGDVLTRKRGGFDARALPGDVVFVPIKTQSTSLLAKIRDISSIIFQLGFSAAALAAIN